MANQNQGDKQSGRRQDGGQNTGGQGANTRQAQADQGAKKGSQAGSQNDKGAGQRSR